MSYRVPIGPYHIALDEPYKIEVDCEGESVAGAQVKVGFNFRGIEWLAQRKNMTRCIALLERVCGICSNVHSMSYCMAMERIAGVEIPKRAQYIRMVVSELERLHSTCFGREWPRKSSASRPPSCRSSASANR